MKSISFVIWFLSSLVMINIGFVFGNWSNLIAGSTYLFGPKIKGPVFFENKGSVIIVVFPSLIKNVACPIQSI